MASSVAAPSVRSYVPRTQAVRDAIKELRKQSFHQYFPAYLHLRQLAGRKGELTGLSPEWRRFGDDYLKVAGAPQRRPYYRPFVPATWSDDGAWLNVNLAGSWAPSSLREGQPPRLVVEYDDNTHTFGLKEKHWELAREHLLDGHRVNAVPLAMFLYRDFAIEDGETPGASDLLQVFREDFQYHSPADDAEFDFLYHVTIPPDSERWFEPFSGGTGHGG